LSSEMLVDFLLDPLTGERVILACLWVQPANA